MRAWHKYLINFNGYQIPGNNVCLDTDKPEEFIEKNYKMHKRFRIYDRYLKKIADSGDRILSVGSGECVNESIMLKSGFNIISSDREKSSAQKTLALFPRLKFHEYDVTKKPFGDKFDLIISFSVFYNFDRRTLLQVFKNIYSSLGADGELVIDFGGAEDNFLTRSIDWLCKYEALIIAGAAKLLRKNCFMIKIAQGYRYRDKELIACAEECGFSLKNLEHHDYFTEAGARSIALRKLNAKFPLFRKISLIFGRRAPYIRIFHFQKQNINNRLR